MRTTRILTAAVVAAAVAAPGTAGAQQSFVTPDAQDARDVPSAAEPRLHQDLATPDAQDAASPRPSTPPPTVVRIVEPAPSQGFSWSDAGIGAAGTAGVVLAAIGIGLPLAHRRRASTIAPGH